MTNENIPELLIGLGSMRPEEQGVVSTVIEKGSEHDPHGKGQHEAGAKMDAGKNRLGLVFQGFCRALMAVGEVGTYGASKYSDNGWMFVTDGVARYTDAMYRHQLSEGFESHDSTGLLHAAHGAWNALARLELMLRAGIESLSENNDGEGAKIAVTRIYGARGTDVFAEGVLSTKGDLIKIEGSRDMEITPDEAARLGKELIRLARAGGWVDTEDDDGN